VAEGSLWAKTQPEHALKRQKIAGDQDRKRLYSKNTDLLYGDLTARVAATDSTIRDGANGKRPARIPPLNWHVSGTPAAGGPETRV
jgi:hypothetical protein